MELQSNRQRLCTETDAGGTFLLSPWRTESFGSLVSEPRAVWARHRGQSSRSQSVPTGLSPPTQPLSLHVALGMGWGVHFLTMKLSKLLKPTSFYLGCILTLLGKESF